MVSNALPVPDPNAPAPAPLPAAEGYDLLLTAAATLHENGEETHGTLAAISRLSRQLGLEATLLPGWSALFLRVADGQVRVRAAAPVNTNMTQVLATLDAVAALGEGRLSGAQAKAALAAARRAPAASLGLFVLACALGAGALVILNGATHPLVVGLVMACAAVGALLRRGLAKWLGANSFLQVLAASLLAGLVGALGVSWHISSAMRLVGLGPVLVMVPGPAILGGTLDLAAQRLTLGLARVGFGLLTVLAISVGVLLGLTLGGTTLPAFVPGRSEPLWVDVLCAGLAAAAYGVFFAMPLRLLIYPVLMGMLAHAVHWTAITHLGLSNAAGAGLACLLVGLVMVPIARRHRLPFAAVGFAAVVSMVPGSFLFRLGGGLLTIQQQATGAPPALIGSVLADGTIALLTVVSMTLGLVLPNSAYNYYYASTYYASKHPPTP